VTQQYDNFDSGHQVSPFSHKEITSVFMLRELTQATPVSRKEVHPLSSKRVIRYPHSK
jgi:hypothetical protein